MTTLADLCSEPKEADETGCVYFVRMGDTDCVKVGQTSRICARMSNLQVSCPTKLHLELQFKTPNHEAIELTIHTHLKSLGLHVRGEWFKLPKATSNHLQVLLDANVMLASFENV
jgi:hypothetical protein